MIGKQIRKARKNAGMTQAYLAAADFVESVLETREEDESERD